MGKFAKAIIAGVTAGVGALGVALTDGSITATEWSVILGAIVYAAVSVWGYPNTATAVSVAASETK